MKFFTYKPTFFSKPKPTIKKELQIDSVQNQCQFPIKAKFGDQKWIELSKGANFLFDLPEIPVRKNGGEEYLKISLKHWDTSFFTERFIWAEASDLGYTYYQAENREGLNKKALSVAGIQKSMFHMKLFFWPDPNFQKLVVIGGSLNHQITKQTNIPLSKKWITFGRAAA